MHARNSSIAWLVVGASVRSLFLPPSRAMPKAKQTARRARAKGTAKEKPIGKGTGIGKAVEAKPIGKGGGDGSSQGLVKT